jgi:hypothetical protein
MGLVNDRLLLFLGFILCGHFKTSIGYLVFYLIELRITNSRVTACHPDGGMSKVNRASDWLQPVWVSEQIQAVSLVGGFQAIVDRQLLENPLEVCLNRVG